MTCLLKGFTTSCGLIMSIGTQNAFILRQSLSGQHLFLTALICSLVDALLISFGVLGFGHSMNPQLLTVLNYTAVLFLLFYGAFSFGSLFKNHSLTTSPFASQSACKTALTLLAFSLLNPHVYLDTILLLGSISSQQADPLSFAIGAISASFAWFFALTFASKRLAPLLHNKTAWKFIDGCTALMMWTIAWSLIK